MVNSAMFAKGSYSIGIAFCVSKKLIKNENKSNMVEMMNLNGNETRKTDHWKNPRGTTVWFCLVSELYVNVLGCSMFTLGSCWWRGSMLLLLLLWRWLWKNWAGGCCCWFSRLGGMGGGGLLRPDVDGRVGRSNWSASSWSLLFVAARLFRDVVLSCWLSVFDDDAEVGPGSLNVFWTADSMFHSNASSICLHSSNDSMCVIS
jgi:hypothetical protein